MRSEAGRRSWRSIVLAPTGDGATRRRGSDAFRLVAAALILVICWAVLSTGPRYERAVLGFLTPPPDGVKWLVTIVWVLGSLGLIIVVGVVALVARRSTLARDVAVAGLAAWGLSYLIEVSVGPNGGGLSGASLAHVDLHYPQPRVAAAVAVALAVVPYLVRRLERVVQIVIVVTAVATIVHGSGLLTSVLASIALGWGVVAAVHLAFGTPLGLLSAADVGVLVEEMGIEVPLLEPVHQQEWGVARYTTAGSGEPFVVSVYGRDARDAQLFAKTFRFVFYRDSGPTLTFTRLQQVEHEAYLTLLAGNHGARVPVVVDAARVGPSHDAVLVTRPPPGVSLTSLTIGTSEPHSAAEATGDGSIVAPNAEIGDRALDAVLGQLMALRAARIAHGSIGTDTIVIDGDEAGLVDFRKASSDATQEQLDRDLGCALSALTLAAGAERVIKSTIRCLPGEVTAAALPFLQRAALSPSLSRQFRGRKDLLDSLRKLGAEAAGVEVPKLAEARRISPVTVALIIGSLIGGWALIGVLVNVGQSFDTIVGADWAWVVAVFILAQAVYPALALEVQGAVIDPLPYGRVLALEIADTFVGLAGGTMAVIATRVRFFQQQGYNATLAVSSGVLISTASWIVKGGLFIIALPFAIDTLHLENSPAGGGARTVWLIIIVVLAVAVLVGVIFAVPRLRRLAGDKLRPKVSDVTAQLKSLATRPQKLAQIFGGAIIAQLCVVLALGASLQAFGDHLSIATLIVVITLAGILGGASPVPGGVGIVEAGLILGLTSAGIPEPTAVAAVFIQRLFTSYLPPIAGWFAMIAMRRREYL